MGRPTIPLAAQRKTIAVSLSPEAISLLDGYVCDGHADSRSRAVEAAIMVLIKLPAMRDRASSKRYAR